MAQPEKRRWVFKARFRRRAFGWRSQPAIQRVREAVSEIARARRKDAREVRNLRPFWTH